MKTVILCITFMMLLAFTSCTGYAPVVKAGKLPDIYTELLLARILQTLLGYPRHGFDMYYIGVCTGEYLGSIKP